MNTIRCLCVSTFMLLWIAPVWAGDRIYTGFFSSNAVSGYDVVSFFDTEKPLKGLKKYRTTYEGAAWLFATEKNLRAFKKNPKRYAPQYGGHCAWAVAANKARAPGDPKHWRVVNGKLYLNYNAKVQDKWLKDIPGFVKAGDENWPILLKDSDE